MPGPIPHKALRYSPSANRLLTSKSTVTAASKTAGERAMDACARENRRMRAERLEVAS
jgi:hypothetical protein